MEELKRNDIKITQNDVYREIMEKENHHKHKIIVDKNGTYRWKADEFIDFAFNNNLIDLNDIVIEFHKNGIDKNSEIYRKLYRDLGYSLSGYWEIFYWESNNSIANEYKKSGILK